MTRFVLPLKRIFRVVNGSTPSSGNGGYWGGEITWITPEDLGAIRGNEICASRRTLTWAGFGDCAAKIVPEGSIILSTRAPIGNLGIATLPLCTNQGCKALVPRDSKGVSSKFYYYWLLANRDLLISYGQGTTFQELGADKLGNLCVPILPCDTQAKVASFLDRKTAAIDGLIKKKERLIELLQEKRQALMTQVVTKGLDPRVPMKDSGVSAFGWIPTNWRVLPLRRVIDEFVDYRGRTPTKVEHGVPLITAGAIRNGRIDHSRVPEYMAPEEYGDIMRRGRPRVGDLVFTTEAPLGEVALVEDVGHAFAQRIILFRVDPRRISSRFLWLFYRSMAGRNEILSRGSGSTAEGIRADRLRASAVLVPPLEQQEAIVEAVVEKLAAEEPLDGAIGKQILLLREYRQSVISAAVTGQLDLSKETA